MSARRGTNDRIRTGAWMPDYALRVGLIVVVAIAAALLIPVVGWQIATVAIATVGALLPQSLGGWLAIGCLTIGMLMSEPSVPHALLGVLFVHVIHVATSLLSVIAWRARIVLAALWPSLRRLLLVQVVAQPVTLLAMVVFAFDVAPVEGAAVAGAGALAVFATLFLLRVRRAQQRS